MSKGRLRVAVVGAGIVGVSAAEWLRRDGHDVTLIDRDGPGRATSFGNGGILARCAVVPVPTPATVRKGPRMLASPNQPLFLRYAYLARLVPWLIPYLRNARKDKVVKIAGALATILDDSPDQHMALAKGTPAEKWIRASDYMYLYESRAQIDKDAFGWELRRAHGFKFEILDRAALSAYDPAIGPAYQAGVLMGDHAIIANPGNYVTDLADYFSAQGGTILRAEVRAIEASEHGVRITAKGSDLQADRVVIASGAWSSGFARQLGHKAGLEAERGYHVEYDGASHRPRAPLMVNDAKAVVTPMDCGLRVAGIVEFGGLKAGPSKQCQDFISRTIRRVFPDFQYSEKRLWMGHRPATVDSLPLLGASPRNRNIYFAFGHQHVGLTAGPKSGRLIADLIAGRRPNIDLEPFRVGRFD